MTLKGWAPTHLTPPAGVAVWSAPDPDLPHVARLEGGTPLRMVERRDAWTGVETSSGAMGWVDARVLGLHPEFQVSHRAPPQGLALRADPDPALEPITQVDEEIAVQLLEPCGHWGRIRTEDGLVGWVEGRRLQGLQHGGVVAPAAPDTAVPQTELAVSRGAPWGHWGDSLRRLA